MANKPRKFYFGFAGKLHWEEQSSWQIKSKVFICLLLITMIATSAGLLLFFLKYTTRDKASIFALFDVDRLTGFAYVLLVIIQLGILLSLWMGIIFGSSILTILNFSAQSIVETFKHFPLGSNTGISKADEFQRFFLLLSSYKQFQLCLILFNEIFRPYFLVLVSNGLTGSSVMALMLVIGYNQHLELIILLTICLLLSISIIALILIYHQCGNLNKGTLRFLKRLKKEIALSMLPKKNKVLLFSYAKSLQPVRVQYSVFGYFKKQNSPRIITRVLYYSVKGIMTLNKII